MKRLSVMGSVLALALLGASLFATSGSAQGGGRTIHLLEGNKGSLFKYVDNPPTTRLDHGFPTRGSRISVGDGLIVRIPLLTPARKKRAGTIHGNCVVTSGGRSFERSVFLCEGVLRLRKGTLTVAGAFRGENTVRFAVTGGTGAYLGARGSFESKERRHKLTLDTIRLVG